METLWNHADMFVLNVSSPNTPGLRDLQHESFLNDVLKHCISVRKKYDSQKPILLKLSPDSSDEQISQMADSAISSGIDGIVATNTTISRYVPKNSQSHWPLVFHCFVMPMHDRQNNILAHMANILFESNYTGHDA